jgi:hypothetical protein
MVNIIFKINIYSHFISKSLTFFRILNWALYMNLTAFFIFENGIIYASFVISLFFHDAAIILVSHVEVSVLIA